MVKKQHFKKLSFLNKLEHEVLNSILYSNFNDFFRLKNV